MSPQAIARANQVYRAYLNTIFEIDHYHENHARLTARSKHIDFLIALGAAASGGSGLGILASADFAWLCGVLTTVSTVGAVAKGSYDWSGRLQKSVEMIEFYTPIKQAFANLTEDINVSQSWTDEFEARYTALRDKLVDAPVETTPQLSIDVRRDIQNRIKQSIDYKSWWAWQESAA